MHDVENNSKPRKMPAGIGANGIEASNGDRDACEESYGPSPNMEEYVGLSHYDAATGEEIVAVSSDWGLRLRSAYGVSSKEGIGGDCVLARRVLRGVVSSSPPLPGGMSRSGSRGFVFPQTLASTSPKSGALPFADAELAPESVDMLRV